jgi:outer membrane protein assembly factor BamB
LSPAAAGNFPTQFVPGDYPTNHFDDKRTGWNPYETVLTTSNVASGSFGLLWTATIDSRSYTQPLVAMQENVAGGTHNVVFVGTQNDTFYAFDADTGAQLWVRSFQNPPTVIAVPASFFGNCRTFAPSMGVTSTPVYDRSTHSLYLVAATLEGVAPNQMVHYRLHQISVLDGSDVIPPTDIIATGVDYQGNPIPFDALHEADRPGLLESNGNIYVAFGSYDDLFHQYARGWIFAYSASTLQLQGFFITVRGAPQFIGSDPRPYFMGTIWAGGIGTAADDQGNVFFATANGPDDGKYNFGDSIMRLPPNLDGTQLSFFTPPNYQYLSTNDNDLGSGGPMLFPAQPGAFPDLLWVAGKNQRAYFVDRDHLAGFAPSKGYIKAIAMHPIFGGPAFYQDANGVAWIYTSDNTVGSAFLAQYKVVTTPTYSVTITARAPNPFTRIGGTTPVVSSNGTMPGTAIVWYLDRPTTTGPIPLYALDASNLSNRLFTATAGQWNLASTGALIQPTVTNGKVYVASDQQLTAFGLH